MIDLKFVIYIIVGIISIGGAVIAFFQMQTRQNMKIEELQKDVEELKRKQSASTGYQIETEKAIVEINTKLDHIVKSIDELKKARGLK